MKKQFSVGFGTGIGIGLVCILGVSLATAQFSSQANSAKDIPLSLIAGAKQVAGVGTITSVDTTSKEIVVTNKDGSVVKMSITDLTDLSKVQPTSVADLKIGYVVSFVDAQQGGQSFFADGLIVSSLTPLRLTYGQEVSRDSETVLRTPFTMAHAQKKSNDKDEDRLQAGTLMVSRPRTGATSVLSQLSLEIAKPSDVSFNRVTTLEPSDLSVGQKVMFAGLQSPNAVAQLLQLKVLVYGE